MVAHSYTIETDPMTWWAYSETHGWVLLDKNLPQNCCPMNPEGYTFLRCRDWQEFEQEGQAWNYKEASRHLKSLTPAEAMTSRRELMEIQSCYAEQLAA